MIKLLAFTFIAFLAGCAGPDQDIYGLPRLNESVNFTSEPSGAYVTVAYGNKTADTALVDCITPCILDIPVRSEIAISVRKDGYVIASKPRLKWTRYLTEWRLEPQPVNVVMRRAE